MTIERYTATIPASGRVTAPGGNFLLLVTASAAVNVRLERGGMSEGLNGAVGGNYLRRRTPWNFLEIFGAAGTTLEYWSGSEEVDRDETDIRLAVSVIAGTVPVNVTCATATTNTAPVDAGTGAETLLIAANLNRKRVKISADPLNTEGATTATKGGLIRGQVGGNNINDIQPGVQKEFCVSHALYVRNDSGATNRFYIDEET